jgi:hypothetical protein
MRMPRKQGAAVLKGQLCQQGREKPVQVCYDNWKLPHGHPETTASIVPLDIDLFGQISALIFRILLTLSQL